MSLMGEMVGISEATANLSNDSPQNSFSANIPPGYSLPHTILIAILVSIFMIIIVFGNLLVVVAIATDRQLKTIQNWFIASLAVADLSLGLVIMPFSLANELMRYWYFGPVWCDLWKAIDVLLCTASILSICLISLDRYWSITRALQYSRQRTPKRAALMITAVWVLSAIVCVPPLIGWKNPLPASEYPLCLLSSEIGYVISSCMGSFYIPAVIMVFVYFKIYQAAKQRARRGRRNKTARKDDQNAKRSDKSKLNDTPLKENTLYCEESERRSVPSEDESTWPVYRKQLQLSNNTSSVSVGVVEEKDSFLSSSSAYDEDESQEKRKHCTIGTYNTPVVKNSISEIPDLYNIEKQKRKLSKARERRATIVLGLVMAAFIFCWFPFFIIYIVTSLCDFCIPEIIFTIAFWAGYCNSALNPIIYTIFNQDFRKSFRKIIFRKALFKR
ncbi:alpha-2A adrenergic receptor-like [Mytilus californianus]|uniref:alpha-2A adrenergic receptor-like n=1 Tax=Mytilus californianus TaxID=6549 RepID=UPI0022486471|nr:alpha-2A adrenergic receptor-like [Mytilus californianus]